MKQHELIPSTGSRKNRKRVGRGDGSGHGSYSTKGIKGQKARTGAGPRPGFEGGQLPLVKRLPQKRGFVNIFGKEYSEVRLERLNRFEGGTEVTPERMWQAGLIKKMRLPVKVLGNGELLKPLIVTAHSFSVSAKGKILAVGGQVREIR